MYRRPLWFESLRTGPVSREASVKYVSQDVFSPWCDSICFSCVHAGPYTLYRRLAGENDYKEDFLIMNFWAAGSKPKRSKAA